MTKPRRTNAATDSDLVVLSVAIDRLPIPEHQKERVFVASRALLTAELDGLEIAQAVSAIVKAVKPE